MINRINTNKVNRLNIDIVIIIQAYRKESLSYLSSYGMV